jgi:hypothetical protein
MAERDERQLLAALAPELRLDSVARNLRNSHPAATSFTRKHCGQFPRQTQCCASHGAFQHSRIMRRHSHTDPYDGEMRTTVTLDPDVAELLKAVVRHRNISFKAALNGALRAGLAAERGENRPCRVPARPLGLRPGLNLTRALRLADRWRTTSTPAKWSPGDSFVSVWRSARFRGLRWANPNA